MAIDAPAVAPLLVVRAVEFGVRPVRLRLPFRFGAVTLRACPQVFVRAVVQLGNGAPSTGFAAEMMVPKWFDKRPQLSHGDNIEHLANSLRWAAQAYIGAGANTAFGLSMAQSYALAESGRNHGLTALSSSFGSALLDRAVLDALCRAGGFNIVDLMRANVAGFADREAVADLKGFDWPRWLAQLQPPQQLQARHTVGLLDALHGQADDPTRLPTTLAGVIHRYGHRVFKIKLGGQPEADLARLAEVLELIESLVPAYQFTLDGNEQYSDPAALLALFSGLRRLPMLLRRPGALLYIEQPLPREQSLEAALPVAQSPAPLLMDEADGSLDAFVQGRRCGWTGVSSKGCKGFYKALINRARCEMWNSASVQPGRYFMSAEDLTCQAGLSVQQDLALAALLGLRHCERNGHHYADGLATSPPEEQAAFSQAHADLYDTNAGHPRLRIVAGSIAIGSLVGAHASPGFASAALPSWHTLQPLSTAASMV